MVLNLSELKTFINLISVGQLGAQLAHHNMPTKVFRLKNQVLTSNLLMYKRNSVFLNLVVYGMKSTIKPLFSTSSIWVRGVMVAAQQYLDNLEERKSLLEVIT